MKKILYFLCCLVLLISGCKKKVVDQERICSRIDMEKFIELFPKQAEEIDFMTQRAQERMLQVLEQISEIPAQQRTYHNTVLAYEQAYLLFFTDLHVLATLAMLSDQAQLQLAANLATQELQQFKIKHLDGNCVIHEAFKQYHMYGKDPYFPTKPIQFFLEYMLAQGVREGVTLPVDIRNELKNLEQQQQQLAGQYCSNVLYDNRHIIVPVGQLTGVSQSVIDGLHQDGKI